MAGGVELSARAVDFFASAGGGGGASDGCGCGAGFAGEELAELDEPEEVGARGGGADIGEVGAMELVLDSDFTLAVDSVDCASG